MYVCPTSPPLHFLFIGLNLKGWGRSLKLTVSTCTQFFIPMLLSSTSTWNPPFPTYVTVPPLPTTPAQSMHTRWPVSLGLERTVPRSPHMFRCKCKILKHIKKNAYSLRDPLYYSVIFLAKIYH